MGPRGKEDDDEFDEEEEEEEDIEEEEEDLEKEDEGDDDDGGKSGGKRRRSYEEEDYDDKSGRKRKKNDFIDDSAEEDEDEEEEEDDDDDEEYGGGGVKKKQKKRGSQFFDLEAQVDDEDEEEEDEEGEDDFINDEGADIPEEKIDQRQRRPSTFLNEDQEDVEEMERQVYERYAKSSHVEYGEEGTEVEQQALLPSVKDPKLWMVKCAIGRERETAICLMQKFIDKPELQIRSAIALDHLKNYIYVEADKEAHVKDACKGLRNIFSSAKIGLVPIKEMTDVLSVESKTIDLQRDTWVRMKIGIYKGDLAKVVDVDNVRQRVTVKLIPRIDLQHLANKLEGRDVGRKKTVVPPPRFFNVDEAREMHLHVERRRDRDSGEYFETIDNMMFKDGFLYKTVAIRSVTSQSIQPTFDELEKFRKPGDDADNDMASLSTLFANRKKGHFMKGDAVVVVRGDLKNLMGSVEKVDEDNVHIRPKMQGLPDTLAFKEKELCKYFNPGDHVKVVSGVQTGATGMVVKVEGHVLIILSDTTKEDIRVFADNVVESSEVTTGITKLGDYELHDLVQLDNISFGVIIRVENDAFQVLKGVPDRPEVVLVKLREIKHKIDRKGSAQDRSRNQVATKDIVRVLEGPCKGRQGPVEHIYRGILFINDRHHLEHAGFICVKATSCIVVGGSQANRDRSDVHSLDSRFARSPYHQSQGRPSRGPTMEFGGRFSRGGRGGHDPLTGRTIKIRSGPYKGYRGRVKEVKGLTVRVELDSQMKVVTVNKTDIADANTNPTTSSRETPRYGMGSETPMHPSRTPLHPYQTPMRDSGATPIHEGMRTPMASRAWAPMSPPRDSWEDENPGSWGTSPQYQPGTPTARPYEAPTPGSGWANTPGGNYTESGSRDDSPIYGSAASPYLPSTPGMQPMTPSSASYLPGTPGGQPMTPGNVGLDVMSPTIGGEGEGNWVMPDILVNVLRPGEESHIGVVREVTVDGSYKIALGLSGDNEVVTAFQGELEPVRPKKSDKIKITSGGQKGFTGKLIGIDGNDGIVKLDDTYEVKILEMNSLAKLATE